MGIQDSKYLTQKEAADYLGFAKSTISMMTSRGELTHYRVGRAVRYTIRDLDNFMQSRKITGMYEESGRKAR
jgi:putative molybdopterin biosynthesis protein